LISSSTPRRLAAVAYEALLLVAVLFIATFVLSAIVAPGRGEGRPALPLPDLTTRVLLFCALFAVAALYFVWSWTGGRRTLPMKTWRMRIVDRNGGAPSYKTALARYLAGWIGPALALVTYVLLKPHGLGGVAIVLLGLNYLAAFVDPERQFLHDRIAGTRIVQHHR
jgi:uncharacterized RDD family membrane protein YckC